MNNTLDKLKNFKLPRWNDLPGIDLYLEQILSLIDNWIGEYMGFDG